MADVQQNRGNIINIGLVAHPDSGKINLFSITSDSGENIRAEKGNGFSLKPQQIEYQAYSMNIFDLQGIYSLSSEVPEEVFVRNFIRENKPDIIINVIDSTMLERDLLLTAQLIEMNLKLIIALDRYDEFKKTGDRFDYISFGRMIGVPVIPVVSSKNKGLAQLLNAVISMHRISQNPREVKINYGHEAEKSISKLEKVFAEDRIVFTNPEFPSRYIAVKLLEKDKDFKQFLHKLPEGLKINNIIEREIAYLETIQYEDTTTLISNCRQGYIQGLLKETYTFRHTERIEKSSQADKILMHRIWGIPFFLFLLWLMFQATFKLGQYPMDWIDTGILWLSDFLDSGLPAGDLKDMLINGIIGGAGGIIRFIPNLLILFLFISIMEDSGYMARAAFLMDKLMHKIGLHGKSFIPMVMGFGCNVPAILTTRIIESRNNRIITMLIIPFISCSARLPVYILMIGAFFPACQGTILFGLYLFGILLSGITAILLRKFYFRQPDIPFVMELPPYRLPTLKHTVMHIFSIIGDYLRKIAGIILIASVITWGLGYYPKNKPALDDLIIHQESISIETQSVPESFSLAGSGHYSGTSYLEQLGMLIEPVIKPLGFDWKMGVSLIAGLAGKEIVVSTLSVMVHDENQPADYADLGKRLKDQKYSNGLPVYTTLTALSFLVFILVYFPCLAVIVTIAKEAGSVWWSVFLALYTTGLAWLISFVINQTGNLII